MEQRARRGSSKRIQNGDFNIDFNNDNDNDNDNDKDNFNVKHDNDNHAKLDCSC